MLTKQVLDENNKYNKCNKLCDNKVIVSAAATQERNSAYHWDYANCSHVLSGLKIYTILNTYVLSFDSIL